MNQALRRHAHFDMTASKWGSAKPSNGVERAPLLEATLDDAAKRGLLCDIETIWLDRSYDSDVTRERLAARLLDDAIIAKKRKKGEAKEKNP